MKKAEVKIGGIYKAKVTNKVVKIRIDEEKELGGWSATNLATNKKITIKTAQRLTAIPNSPPHGTKVTTTGNLTIVESEPARTEVFENANEKSKRVLKKPNKSNAKTNKIKASKPTDQNEKKMSCVAAALKVLGESTEPMNTKQMIEAMEAKGYWQSPGGKTPHATLYSAILRDLTKGEESRFVKVERGLFTVRKEA